MENKMLISESKNFNIFLFSAENSNLQTTDARAPLISVSSIFRAESRILSNKIYKSERRDRNRISLAIRVLDASRKNIAPAYQVSRAGSKFDPVMFRALRFRLRFSEASAKTPDESYEFYSNQISRFLFLSFPSFPLVLRPSWHQRPIAFTGLPLARFWHKRLALISRVARTS